jgi:hypothetical protein
MSLGRQFGETAREMDEAAAAARPAVPRSLIFVMSVIALAKAAILIADGPSVLPDSGGYIEYADAILDHFRAFAPMAWGAEAAPLFIFRPPGYPLALALAKLISPAGYAVVAVVLQNLLNGIAIFLIFVVAARLMRSTGAALVVVVLYAFSTSVLWDNAILSDSLYGSLWNIVVFVLLGHLLGCWRLGIGHSLGLGLLWGGSLWVRDVGIYFSVFPVALFLLIVLRERSRLRCALAHLLAFLVVTAGMAGGLVLLNYHRTGEAFYSITGVENWLRPVFDMARSGQPEVFAGDDLVSTTVRETMTDYGFESQLTFLGDLHARCRCMPTQMMSLVFDKYCSTVIRHPLAYAREVARNFNYLALGELVADPVATINQFFELGSPDPQARIPGFSLRNIAALARHFSMGALVLMLLSAIAEVMSAIVFSVYLFGTPYMLLRVGRDWRGIGAEELAIGYLWLSFVGVSLAFSLVHYEARHALPLFPAAAIGIVYIGRWLLARSRRPTIAA